MMVTELKCDQPNFGITALIPNEDAYPMALQFRSCLDHDLYFEGNSSIRPAGFPEPLQSTICNEARSLTFATHATA